MLNALKATARDVALAALAAFVGALALALGGDVEITVPVLKAAVIGAGYAALRAAVGYLAIRFGS